MILDENIEIVVKSSSTIGKLNEIGVTSKIGDVINLPIEKLWKGSNIKVNVKCDICENVKSIIYTMYVKNIKKYNIYSCSNKCSYFKNKKTNLERYGKENYFNIDKLKETNLERYGVDYVLKLENVREKSKKTRLDKYSDENYNNREKSKETNLERYGVDNYSKTSEYLEKYKKTSLEKYNADHYSKTPEYLEKYKKTSLDRYGVDNYSKTPEYLEKCKITNLERYGCESSNSCDFIKEKKVMSMLNKYGFISNSMTKESKEKLRKTNLERYGVEYPMQLLEFSEKQQKNSKRIIYYNDDIYYQSSYEKDFLDHISDINMINDITRGPSIKYVESGSTRYHFPDFYIESMNLIVEIKSDYYYYKFLEKNELKKKTAINLGYNYIFIINKKYQLFDKLIYNVLKKENQS